MAEQDDNTLVTIHLDAPRQYRDRETMIVTEIGPGRVKVSRETARRWGIAPVGAHKVADDDKAAGEKAKG